VELANLIRDSRVELLGPIRQELLSGIRSRKQFTTLRDRLAAFPDLALSTDDYVLAAMFCNQCRAEGIQASNTDFLICAAAVGHDLAVFTTDHHFDLLSQHLPITLHRL
jgi:predicted nucleic acid-binding protein